MNFSLRNSKVKTIGIVSPASPDDSAFIKDKINILKNYGYKIIEGTHLYDKYGYLAGEDKNRANDINSMFNNKDVDAILCFRGGYGSIRMIDFLDLKLIKNSPKIFCGYSDITLLLNYIAKTCNFPTFHGPMVNSNLNDIFTRNSLTNLFNSNNSSFIYDLTKLKCSFLQNKFNFSGTIVGGNLSIICSSIGTPYEINFDNSILLIEEINEHPYALDRMLSQLLFSNRLSKCNGIILGHFTNCGLNDYSKSFSVDEVLIDRLSSLNIPVIKDFPSGHDYPNIVLPIGCEAYYNSKTNILSTVNNVFI